MGVYSGLRGLELRIISTSGLSCVQIETGFAYLIESDSDESDVEEKEEDLFRKNVIVDSDSSEIIDMENDDIDMEAIEIEEDDKVDCHGEEGEEDKDDGEGDKEERDGVEKK